MQKPKQTNIEHLLLIEGRSPKAILDEHFTKQSLPVLITNTNPDQLEHNLYRSIIIPPDIKTYIDGQEEELTANEIHNIEEAIEKHYHISEPYYIAISSPNDLLNPDFFLGKETK